MSTSVNLTLDGGAELEKLLEAMPDRLRDNVMRGAMLAGARVIRDRARQLAPIGSPPLPRGREPGELKKNIVAARTRSTGDMVAAIVGITHKAFYGRFVEFGTAASGGHPTKKGGHTRAHHATRAYPFMRPAADEEAQAAAQAVIDYASQRVVQAAIGAGLLDAGAVDEAA